MAAKKIVLWIVGLSFLAFGGWALISPSTLASLIHFDLTSATAVTEMRAFYGGVGIGLGLFMIVGASKPQFTAACLLGGALILGCIALSRISGLIIDGGGSRIMLAALGSEIVGMLACLWAMRRA